MKLLVACPFRLLQVDVESHEIRLAESGRPEYYGISWPFSGDRLCLSHSGIDNTAMASLDSYIESEVGYLSLGDASGPQGLSAPHQIVCTSHHIIGTNTGRNCITVFQQDNLFYRNYWLEKARWDRKGRDRYCGSHFNSVYLRENRLFVVASCVNRSSEVLELSWPTMEILNRWRTSAKQAHNVWVTESGQVILCDSMRGSVVDSRTNEILWTSNEPHTITRGLACDGRHVFIGRTKLSNRLDRTKSDGGIWVVDLQSWITVDYIHLPNTGSVNELRLTDVPDYCHHCQPFKGTIQTEPYIPDAEISPIHSDLSKVSLFPLGWTEHLEPSTLCSGIIHSVNAGLATLDSVSEENVYVEAIVDVGSEENHYAGIVARYRGPDDTNMLTSMLHREANQLTVEIWSNMHGEWSCLGAKEVDSDHGKLELICEGHFVQAVFNGEIVIETEYEGHTAGSLGYRTHSGRIEDFHYQKLGKTEDSTVGLLLRRSAA